MIGAALVVRESLWQVLQMFLQKLFEFGLLDLIGVFEIDPNQIFPIGIGNAGIVGQIGHSSQRYCVFGT